MPLYLTAPNTLFRSRRFATSAITAAMLNVLSGTAMATDSPEIKADKKMEVVEVSGDWIRRQLLDYPGASTNIDSKDILRSGALNLEDALRVAPGVQVLDETGTGVLPNIGLRGLNPLRSERLQMLVDGYPIAIGPYSNIGVSLFPVTMDSIDNMEIVRGGAAVHYGPNNVGGVLSLSTQAIPVTLQQTFRQRLTVADSTGNVFSDTYYDIGGMANEDLAMQFQANIQRGNGWREHSGTQVDNYLGRGAYRVDDDNQLEMSLQYYDVDAELPGALSPSRYDKDRTQSQRPYDRYKADMVRGTFTWTYTPTSDIEFKWRNFAHRADRTFYFGQDLTSGGNWADPDATPSHVADSPRVFNVWSTEPRLTIRSGNHTVTTGVRYVREDVDFDVNRTVLANGNYLAVRRWQLTTNAWAGYISDTMVFMDGRFKVTPGVRYENAQMDFVDTLSNTSSDNNAKALLPGITLGFDATDAVFLFGNVQRSLVPAQIAQVTKSKDVANETAWNYELGGRWQLTPTFSTKMTLFRIDYDDQIQYNKAMDIYENLGRTLHQGVELENKWQLAEGLALELNYGYLNTEQKNGINQGKDLPNAPHHHASAAIDYQWQQWNARVTANYAGSSYSDAANTEQETANGDAGKLPSYTLVNMYVGRELSINNKALQVSFAVNNLFDKSWYFRGSDVSPVGRIPGPGRSFMIDVALHF